MARRYLKQFKQLTSIDSCTEIIQITLYSCSKQKAVEAKARFIERLKQNAKLYVEERKPSSLEAAILFDQFYDTMRFRSYPEAFGQKGNEQGNQFVAGKRGHRRVKN